MADSRELDYKSKLFRHRAGRGAKILACAVVVIIAVISVRTWIISKTYTEYEVVSSASRSDTVNTQYEEYNGRLLKYSRDGIACVSTSNEAYWSQTYNMSSPIISVCGNYVAVADQQGKEVYVFNMSGLLTQITTLLPIQQISVSGQGVTALMLNDSSYAWLYLYDKDGNELAEARCSLEETGQPLSIGISENGTLLAVSYLQVQDGSAGSCVVFYNFGSVGSNFVDKIVASKTYSDTIIPKVRFLGSDVCVAVSDQGLIYFEGSEIPEETTVVTEDREIESVFFGDGRVGLIVEGVSSASAGDDDEIETGRYEIHLYNTDGDLVLSQTTDLDYTQVKISDGSLIIISGSECEIYSEYAVLKYAGSFDGEISNIYKTDGLVKYVFVFSDRTDVIRLK